MFLIEYIKKYKVTYISVVITFVIGICIGIFVTFKMPENEKKDLTDYLHQSVQIIQENNLDKQSLFKEKLLENFRDVRNNLALGLYSYSKFYHIYFHDLQRNIMWLHNNDSAFNTRFWPRSKVSDYYDFW